MAIACSNSDVVEFGLVHYLMFSLGSDRAVAPCVDSSFLVGFGSVDVAMMTGPALASIVCFSRRRRCSLSVVADTQ